MSNMSSTNTQPTNKKKALIISDFFPYPTRNGMEVTCYQTIQDFRERNIDIKLMRKQKDIEKFSNQQLQLLEEGWKILKSGGKLLYVTCSIFKHENENVVMKFLSKNKDAASQDLKIPNGFKYQNTQLIPNQFHDGLYFKVFSKN